MMAWWILVCTIGIQIIKWDKSIVTGKQLTNLFQIIDPHCVVSDSHTFKFTEQGVVTRLQQKSLFRQMLYKIA